MAAPCGMLKRQYSVNICLLPGTTTLQILLLMRTFTCDRCRDKAWHRLKLYYVIFGYFFHILGCSSALCHHAELRRSCRIVRNPVYRRAAFLQRRDVKPARRLPRSRPRPLRVAPLTSCSNKEIKCLRQPSTATRANVT